jgi:hypothetical protein
MYYKTTETKMETKPKKAEKPRSTRYTDEQLEFFANLEKVGRNVSHFIREAVAEKMAKEQPKTAN